SRRRRSRPGPQPVRAGVRWTRPRRGSRCSASCVHLVDRLAAVQATLRAVGPAVLAVHLAVLLSQRFDVPAMRAGDVGHRRTPSSLRAASRSSGVRSKASRSSSGGSPKTARNRLVPVLLSVPPVGNSKDLLLEVLTVLTASTVMPSRKRSL